MNEVSGGLYFGPVIGPESAGLIQGVVVGKTVGGTQDKLIPVTL